MLPYFDFLYFFARTPGGMKNCKNVCTLLILVYLIDDHKRKSFKNGFSLLDFLTGNKYGLSAIVFIPNESGLRI